nr:type VI secretion system protein TssA [Cedecea sulfonylureivorans]
MTASPAYYDFLLETISPESPCGINLEYDSAFIMLQSKLQPKLGAEYGNFVEAADPVNWVEVERECLGLLQKSRDIRLVIVLMRCRIRQKGLSALNEGLSALDALLRQFPDDLYPQLMDEGEFEPLMRANALAELDAIDSLLSDIRSQSLPSASGLQISVKEYEKAYSSNRDEEALSQTSLHLLKQHWEERADATLLSLQQAAQTLEGIISLLETSLGEDAPDFARLKGILNLFASDPAAVPKQTPEIEHIEDEHVIEQENEGVEELAEAPQPPGKTTVRPSNNPGIIESRIDALSRLREVRAWYEKTEPSSPVILLLSFAEKTAGMSFSALTKMISSEMIAQLSMEGE